MVNTELNFREHASSVINKGFKSMAFVILICTSWAFVKYSMAFLGPVEITTISSRESETSDFEG